MERKFELRLVNPDHYLMKGIYLIRIGRMKYVGKALLVGERIIEHQRAINRVLKDFSEFINLGIPYQKFSSYLEIGRYLLENPRIDHGIVEVLERQVCSTMLYHAENFYLTEFVNNPDAYNISWRGGRPRKDESNFWDVTEVEGRLEYFDRKVTHIKVNSAKPVKQNEPYLKMIADYRQSKDYRKARLNEWHESIKCENNSLEVRKAIVEYMMRELSKP